MKSESGESAGLLAAVFGLATALLRALRLRTLPIFGDEAIHLHWAQLIRQDPPRFAFVSLQDPKPPLHFWLLALALPVSPDPVLAGRLLSLLCGALSTALFFSFAKDLCLAWGFDPTRSRKSAICGAVLLLLCPFLAFHQRIALTESLFVLEAVATAWLSVRLAVAAATGRPIGGRALALGIVLGVAMLTRQDFSYALWALPVLAWWMAGARRRGAIPALAIAAVTALVLWCPVLLSAAGPDWKTRVFHSAAYREPISLSRRIGNAIEVLGWFAAYLTPPVALLSLAGAWILLRRKPRAGIFVAGWWLSAVAPLWIFASQFFPRYFLPGALPLLIAAAIALERALDHCRQRSRALTAAVILVILAWPAADLFRAWTNAADPPLVAIDRWQYVSGWPAGSATERAIAEIRRFSARERLTVIAPQISGNPGDSLRVLLRGDPRVALWTAADYLEGPVLRPDGGGGFLVRGDFRAGEAERSVSIPAREPVFFVATDPLATRAGWVPAREFLASRNPGLREVARFFNPPDATRPPAGIVLFRVR